MPLPENNLAVGIIGTGDMARFYAQTIQQHIPWVRLVAVSSQNEERAETFAGNFDIPCAYGSHEEIFQSEMDALMIVSASDTHSALIEQAAQHRIDTFCDKPLGVSLDAIDTALEAVTASGIRFATGFNRRFDPAFQRLYRQVQDGTIGTPEAAIIISRDPCFPTPPELATPHRLLIGSAIHDFDMARFLMQDEVVSITAQGSWLTPEPPANEQLDATAVTLRFRRGGLATLINSYRSLKGYDQRVELFGSKAIGRVDNECNPPPEIPDDAPFFVKRYASSYAVELKAFFGSLQSGEWDPALATEKDGRAASQLAEAAICSYREQCAIQI